MHLPKQPWLRLFAAVLLLLPLSAAGAADAPGTRPQDSFKKRVEREKAFLLMGSDDLGRTLAFVKETTALLNEQVEAAGHGADNRAGERQDLLEWYQKYADWTSGMSSEFDLAVNNFFLGQADAGRTARYEELAEGSRKLAGELGERVLKLEGEKKKLETRRQKLNAAVVERRVPVDKDDLELARELWPAYRSGPYDRREAHYKDLSDEEVFYFQNELRSLGEERKYFECLSELEKYEEGWLLIKADEFAKLYELAGVIGGDAPGPLASALRGTIRTYEANRATLTKRSGELDAKLHDIAGTGTLGTLDRLEELSRYYGEMKNRFERHIEWLGARIGSCRADLIELGKEL